MCVTRCSSMELEEQLLREADTWAAGVLPLGLGLTAAARLVTHVLQVHLDLFTVLLHRRLRCRDTGDISVTDVCPSVTLTAQKVDSLSSSLKSLSCSA